jgi:hypothetical protein
MYLPSRFHVCAFLLAAALPLSAQDDIPLAGRGGRGGGNTREFLGLGQAPCWPAPVTLYSPSGL